MIKDFKVTIRIAKALYLQLKDEAEKFNKPYSDYIRLKLSLSFKETLIAVMRENENV